MNNVKEKEASFEARARQLFYSLNQEIGRTVVSRILYRSNLYENIYVR